MEHIQLLKGAAQEIEQLRRQVEVLSAKVEVMDLFALTLKSQPAHTPQYFSPDLCVALRRTAEGLERERTAADNASS